MRRLKAVLSPAPVAGLRSRMAVLGLGVAVAAVAGTGSVALAAKREPVVVEAPAEAVTPAPMPVFVEVPVEIPATAPVSADTAPQGAPSVRPDPAPEPEPVVVREPTVITNPLWAQYPTPRFPAAALEQGSLSGRASLSCTFEANGRLSACRVLSVDPEGLGYEAAALEAAASARLAPRTVDEAPAGSTVQFSVRFSRRE